MGTILKKLAAAQSRYEAAIGNAERELSRKIDFEFTILWQPGDGFVICYEGDRNISYNAGIKECLAVIGKKGKLSVEDYLMNTL